MNVNYNPNSWLKSAIQESSISHGNDSWLSLQDEIASFFLTLLHKYSEQPVARQCLFECFGREFVALYCSEYQYDESLLLPPNMVAEMVPEIFQKIAEEFEAFSDKIIAQMQVDPSPVVKTYLENFTSNLKFRINEEISRRTARDVLFNSSDNNDLTLYHSFQVHGEMVRDFISSLASPETPQVFDELSSNLKGIFLPSSLRVYLWKRALNQVDLSKTYVTAVTDRMISDSVTYPSFSPIKNLLIKIWENTITDFFQARELLPENSDTKPVKIDRKISMKLNLSSPVLNNTKPIKTTKSVPFVVLSPLFLAIANRFYLFCDEYGSRILFLACQLVEVLSYEEFVYGAKIVQDGHESNAELERHINTLTIYLIALCKQIHLNMTVKRMAALVWENISREQVSLSRHVEQIFKNNPSSFLLEAGSGGLIVPLQPVSLVERWLEYCFCGFLRSNSVLFIWDQCILSGWSLLVNFAEIIFQLLENKIMGATTVKELDNICVFDVRHLLTKDIVEKFRARK